MDPTTTLTTVAGAITIASKIITDLELLTNARFRTPRETSLVETEVRTLHGTLQTVQAHFDPQRGDYMPIQLEQLHHVSVRAKTTLDALNAMIGRPRLPVLFRKVRWTMNMAEVERHRLTLAGCTSRLNVLVATLCNQRGASIEALALKCYEIMENQVGTQSGQAGTSVSPRPVRIPVPSVLTRSLERNFVPAAEANATSEVFLRKAPQTPTLATVTTPMVDPDFAPILEAQAIIQKNIWIKSLSIPIVYVTNSLQRWGYLYLDKSKIAFIKDATLQKVKLEVQQDKDYGTQNYYRKLSVIFALGRL